MHQLFERFKINESLFPLPSKGEKKRYLLKIDELSELILMIWGIGAISPIHDHAGSECLTTILKGELVEKTYSKDSLKLCGEEILSMNGTSYIDKDEGVHQLLNKSSGIVYSIHLYKKPLSHCNVFDTEKQRWSKLENYYDEIIEERV